MNKVVITGMGIASPFGLGAETFWQALVGGRSGVAKLKGIDTDNLPITIGAQVGDSEFGPLISKKESRRMSRSSQLALAAAEEAIAMAGLDSLDQETRNEVAIIVGSSIGGFSASDPYYQEFYESGKQSGLVIPISMNSGPSANISIRYGFGGAQFTADAACATAAHSIGMLFNQIRSGQVEIGVTGGADSPFSRAVLQAWSNLRVVSTRNGNPESACRPFSADRDGMVLGEGAGILVLESEASAVRRGVRVLAELKGYGASSDSHHITQPTLNGPARAMCKAMKDAGLGIEDIHYINAHATATQWNDRNETAVVKHVFHESAHNIPVVGTKAAHGHSIGASGALELISCVLSLQHQRVPPTINYHEPDPDCDLDYVTSGSRPVKISNAMCNSFAFGGSNASIIVGK